MNQRKYGVIEVSENYYETFWKHVKNFIPLRIEYFKAEAIYKIEAYCDQFQLLEEGDSIPQYISEPTESKSAGEIIFVVVKKK